MARYLEFSYTDENATIIDVGEDPQDAPGEVSVRLEDAQYRSLSAWLPLPAVQALRGALTAWLDRRQGQG